MRLATSSTVIRFYQWPLTGEIGDICIPRTASDAPVKTISWNNNGSWLASVAFRKTPEVFKISEEHPMKIKDMQQITGHGHVSTCAAFQNTVEKSIVLGTVFKQVVIYDIQDKKVKHKFEVLPAQINQVGCTAEDTHIVAGLNNGEIIVYSNTSRGLFQKFVIPKSTSCIRLRCHSSKHDTIMAGSDKGIIALFNTNVTRAVYMDAAHAGPVTSVCFSPPCCHGVAVSSGRDGTLVYHDVNSLERFFKCKMEDVITALDFAPDGMFLITGSHNGQIAVFDIRNRGNPVYRFQAYNKEVTNVLMQKQESAEIPASYSFFERCKRAVLEPMHPQPPSLDAIRDSAMALFIGEYESTLQNAGCSTTEGAFGTQKVEPRIRVSTSTQTEEAGIQHYDKVSKDDVIQMTEKEFQPIVYSASQNVQKELHKAQGKTHCEVLDLRKSVERGFFNVEKEMAKIRRDLEINQVITDNDEVLQNENQVLKGKLKMLKKKLSQKRK